MTQEKLAIFKKDSFAVADQTRFNVPRSIGRCIKNVFKICACRDKTADIAEDVPSGGWIKVAVDRDCSGCVGDDKKADATIQAAVCYQLLNLVSDKIKAVALTAFNVYRFVHMVSTPNLFGF